MAATAENIDPNVGSSYDYRLRWQLQQKVMVTERLYNIFYCGEEIGGTAL